MLSILQIKHKTNMKMFWSGIRCIINSKSNVGSSISCLTLNSVKVDDSKQMTSIFNNVFVNTAKKTKEDIPRTRKSPLEYLSSQNESFSCHQPLLRKLKWPLTHSKVVKLSVLTVYQCTC